ncbi:hypothetical protein Glo7428_3493 [Gloeocapsa sp. PCC 7428]|nr:hypothetical protein Glo7428_3493 [Gloeocapsa sp. PCC 7428]
MNSQLNKPYFLRVFFDNTFVLVCLRTLRFGSPEGSRRASGLTIYTLIQQSQNFNIFSLLSAIKFKVFINYR